jgi:uncharacterized protein DUF6496
MRTGTREVATAFQRRDYHVEESAMARRYSKKASRKVQRAMHERKRGTLRSGRSGRKVKSRKQAIAIGLSEARRSGAKVPKKKGGSRKRKTSRRRSSKKK